MSSKAGELYIVATPIGNLKDMTFRAVEVLQQVDLILAEDTRTSLKLLQHFGIRNPMQALHEHNEEQSIQGLLQKLRDGSSLALISDAGTPLMSDPGYRLVSAAQSAGIQAVAVPGACAAIAALSIAGLPTDRFAFEGFMPSKTAAREQQLGELTDESRTLVFYEARHRITSFLESLLKVFGPGRRVVVARELTKKFETVYATRLGEIVNEMAGDEQAHKGEFVVLLEGAANSEQNDADLDEVLRPLVAELGVSKASKLAAKLCAVNKNRCYQRALQIQAENESGSG